MSCSEGQLRGRPCSSACRGQKHELKAVIPVLPSDSLAVQISTCSVMVDIQPAVMSIMKGTWCQQQSRCAHLLDI